MTSSGRWSGDLIKSLETGQIAIVDFRSTEGSQDEGITRDQLSIYALGYQYLTGESADRILILNLDDNGKSANDPVNAALIEGIRSKVAVVAGEIRNNQFACTDDHSRDAVFDDLAWLTRR